MQLVDAAATAESVAAVVVFAAIRAPATNPSSPPWPPPLPAVFSPRRRLAATASLVHALLVFASFLAWCVNSRYVYGPDGPSVSIQKCKFDLMAV